MKKQILALLPWLLALAADFYLLPALIRDTGTAMLVMLVGMPLLAFLIALACGLREGFRIPLPLLAGVLFLPSVPLYYNGSAWVYGIIYAIVVLAGMGLGRLFYRRR